MEIDELALIFHVFSFLLVSESDLPWPVVPAYCQRDWISETYFGAVKGIQYHIFPFIKENKNLSLNWFIQ